MRIHSNKMKYKDFCSVFVNNSGYIGPNIGGVDKSLYPFLVGHRNKICYLDVWKNSCSLGDSFKVIRDIVSDRGNVLLVGGNLFIVSALLGLRVFNVVVSPWDFSQIRNKSRLDLIVVHEVDSVSILESESKYAPYILVNGTNIWGVTYPCNISMSNPVMGNLYLYALVNSCRRGLYSRNKNLNEI